ncbi:MAG: methylmalonyl Co-A mutase-associated GTPase MeaB [Gammaproteobacteria bacterium]|jgi:LAO/AO transport system kinase|nr:methylmalonyl Co-A mutase-associated GTPase MeaB [Gammaproteobacteria bacterium]
MAAVDAEQLAAQIRDGERRALARAITLIESSRAADRPAANRLLEQLVPHSGRSMRIGVSGVPGVGKSTFIESLGNFLVDQGHKVAVLAVDPSSAVSGGSILGDKTRMELLSRRPEAFIRPSPAGETLGGVARRTRETMLLAEAAGYDIVLIETVGVGQSETTVSRMTDMFLLMLLPAGGDELQGIKRGIVELADLILVNKADGDLKLAAERSVADYRKATAFLAPRQDGWRVPVEPYSALQGSGLATVWEIVESFKAQRKASGQFDRSRAAQSVNWMWAEINGRLIDRLKADAQVSARIAELEAEVRDNMISPTTAADELINIFVRRTEQQD